MHEGWDEETNMPLKHFQYFWALCLATWHQLQAKLKQLQQSAQH